jgi:hypothetical protein
MGDALECRRHLDIQPVVAANAGDALKKRPISACGAKHTRV